MQASRTRWPSFSSTPNFLFRSEIDPPVGTVPGTAYRISDVELASRLSFFLWSSIPDDHLLTLAAQNKLLWTPWFSNSRSIAC